MMLCGKKLQFIRIRNNMTQEYIADCLGVSKRWIGMVENTSDYPSQEVYDKWILALYGGLKPVKKNTETAKKDTVKKTSK